VEKAVLEHDVGDIGLEQASGDLARLISNDGRGPGNVGATELHERDHR